jgi:hypothetical protein
MRCDTYGVPILTDDDLDWMTDEEATATILENYQSWEDARLATIEPDEKRKLTVAEKMSLMAKRNFNQ